MNEDKPEGRVGWIIYEEVGVGVTSPAPLFCFEKPDWMSQDDFEKMIKELEDEIRNKEEMDRSPKIEEI